MRDYYSCSRKYFIHCQNYKFWLIEQNFSASQELTNQYEELEAFGTEVEAIAECDRLDAIYNDFCKLRDNSREGYTRLKEPCLCDLADDASYS